MLSNPKLFDRYGFLIESDRWTEKLAARIAAELGIGKMQSQHFVVIQALRRHYAESQAIHPPLHVCHELGMPKDCIDSLFKGPLNAWKAAGLPNPGEEARVYLDNQTPDA